MRSPLLAFLLLLGCGTSGDEGLATLSSAKTECQQRHSDNLTGLTFDIPCSFNVSIAFENPDSPPFVIKRRISVTGPGEFEFVLDAWEDQEGLSLEDWLLRFGVYAVYEGSEFSEGLVGRARMRAYYAFAGGECSPLKEYVLFAHGGYIFRLMYVNTDDGARRADFDRIVQGFTLSQRQGPGEERR